MLAKFKPLFFHPGLSIALCGMALFLIGNSLYLNTIRDQKAESLENLEQTLEVYQAGLAHQGKGTPSALKPFVSRFHYGAFLNTALKAFDQNPSLTFTEIQLGTEDLHDTTFADTQTFPPPSPKRKTKPEKIEVLTLLGEIDNASKAYGSYQQLTELIAQSQGDTHCQWVLTQVGEQASSQEVTPNPGKLHFLLTFRPKAQKDCWLKYTQGEFSQ